METLSWTGSLGSILIPALTIAAAVFVIGVVMQLVMGFFAAEVKLQSNADGTLESRGGLLGRLEMLNGWLFLLVVALVAAFIVISWFMPYGDAGILGEISKRFLPTWIALIATFVVSITFKRKLGLYGKLFDSMIGMIGFALVMFWVFTAIFVGLFDMIATFDPVAQPTDLQIARALKNGVPGLLYGEGLGNGDGAYPHYLLGGDNLARDIFSRMVYGSVIVMVIAPLATIFAFMVGITLGLPAGYYGGVAVKFKSILFWVLGAIALAVTVYVLQSAGTSIALMSAIALAVILIILTITSLDTVLSFLANLILAFPVILLFYLLVTPEIVATGLPNFMAAFLFVFPLIFFGVLINSRYKTQQGKNILYLALVLTPLAYLYASVVSEEGTPLHFWPNSLDLITIPSGILVVFVSVVFVNSPTVYRIVRGLTLDIKTRDYVAAAQTRGEGTWYIMLWEILPNARGPLIVDFCLRIGYTTILLGTLGFFGLGLPPESPDWGSTINEGRKLLLIYAHPALPPAIALLSLVLGLNLLADGLREESLKD